MNEEPSVVSGREQASLLDEQLYTYRLIRIVCKIWIFLSLLLISVFGFFCIMALVFGALISRGTLMIPFIVVSSLLIGVPVAISVYRAIDRSARSPKPIVEEKS